MNCPNFTFFALTLIISLSDNFAQVPGYHFHHLKTADGLSQASNAYVYRDSRGFIWISSIDGLNRFDGLEVKIYRPRRGDAHSINGQLVNSGFFEDRDANIWFATYSAINRYNRKTDDFDSWLIEDPKSGNRLREDYHVLFLDPVTNRLWVQIGYLDTGQLFFFDMEQGTSQLIGPLFGDRFVVQFDTTAHPSNPVIYSYFYSREAPLFRTEITGGGKLQTTHFFGEKGEQSAFKDLLVKGDTLFLTGNFGVAEFFPDRDSLNLDFFSATISGVSIAQLMEGQIGFTTEQQGLFFFQREIGEIAGHFKNRAGRFSSLSSNKLNDIYLDPTNTLWISDWNSGLNYIHLDKPKVQNIMLSDLFPGAPAIIKSLVEDQAGNVWCATTEKGIIVFKKNGEIVQLDQSSGLPDQRVNQLFLFRREIMFALTNNGLFWWDKSDKRFRKIAPPEMDFDWLGIMGSLVSDRLFFHNLATYEIKKEPGKWSYYLEKSDRYPVLEGQFIAYWYRGTTGDLYCNVNSANTIRISPEGQVDTLDAEVRDLRACWEPINSDSIWLATTYGLFRMSKSTGEYRWFDDSNGLPNQYLYSALPDRSGHLWMSTHQGITRFHTQSHTVRQLTLSDGIWENEFYTNAALLRSDGSIWLANLDVINVIDPENFQPVTTLPLIQITELLVNDQLVEDSIYIGERSGLELPFNQNTLSLKFVALEYSDPQNNQLWYRLDGFDPEGQWLTSPKGSPGFARYPKLPPGRYHFQVEAANSDGVRTPEPYVLAITILKPFYYQWWFILLVIAILSGLAYSIYRYRVAQLRRTYQLQQQTVESEMKALRAQMNPHFIFNSINSINAFVLRNQSSRASEYLNNFARLIRQILDISSRETIPLEEEIEFLEGYLQAEQLRLKEKLHWRIEVDDAVDTFEIEIPTMILQPFVENAIWHGISKKTTPVNILIQISKENSTLKCLIEDDGIGRKVSREIRQQFRPGHQSQGEKNTRERLALYDRKKNTASSWEIRDLVGKDGQAKGTQVILKIGLPG